jgi:hypothetical protein
VFHKNLRLDLLQSLGIIGFTNSFTYLHHLQVTWKATWKQNLVMAACKA